MQSLSRKKSWNMEKRVIILLSFVSTLKRSRENTRKIELFTSCTSYSIIFLGVDFTSHLEVVSANYKARYQLRRTHLLLPTFYASCFFLPIWRIGWLARHLRKGKVQLVWLRSGRVSSRSQAPAQEKIVYTKLG